MKIRLIIILIVFLVKFCRGGYDVNGAYFEDEIFQQEFDGRFRYTACDGLLKPLVIINKLEVNPKMFYIPQNVSMTIGFVLMKNIEPPIQIQIDISKHLGFMGYVKLPCIANYGSCTFGRVCEILETYPEDSFAYKVSCPNWLKKSGVACKCPVKKGSYGVVNVRVPIESSIVPKWIATGDYKAAFIINDGNRTVGCFRFQFRLQ